METREICVTIKSIFNILSFSMIFNFRFYLLLQLKTLVASFSKKQNFVFLIKKINKINLSITHSKNRIWEWIYDLVT